jgi:hypothetical protein
MISFEDGGRLLVAASMDQDIAQDGQTIDGWKAQGMIHQAPRQASLC